MMAEEADNLVLALLRRMDAKLDRALEDLHDIKVRVTAVEENLAGVHRRIDRVDERVERIERRLDLTEAPH